MAGIRFYIDSATGLPHISRHGVEDYEVIEVLESAAEDRPGRDDSRIAIGQTLAGRYLRVIYVPGPLIGEAFVITAYDLAGASLAAFRRRLRRKRGR